MNFGKLTRKEIRQGILKIVYNTLVVCTVFTNYSINF
jgi:hypothetical protein